MNSHLWHSRILWIFLAAAAFGESISNQPQPPKFRLPDVAAPERYRVSLALAPGKESFSGTIDIDLTFKRSTSVLWLNAEELTVKSADFASGGESLPLRIVPTASDFVGFLLGRPIGPGRARLRLSFEGQISSKDTAGIFQVKEGDRSYIYSQFENIFARRAFPCFDEPSYKVPWQITLTIPAHDSAFSNTPIRSESADKHDMKTVVFSETKPLPSYLVALAVGPFDVVNAGRAGANRTAVRIIVPKGHSSEARYAATTTPKFLDLLERYFCIPYPYEKLDEVAIPYAGYAMEHPGLVTYGSLFFLLKPDAPLALLRDATNVIAHELAHQWFGDLVTMQWWDDTWLNEAFASWMANKIVNQYRPEWNMNIDEMNGYQRAMVTDELPSSRKIRQEILSNDDIENAFDEITYNKGSGVLNMFESYMGQEEFRQGIQRYLRKYSWRNATSAEFLHELTGDDRKLTKAFLSFLDQAGVPLVTLKVSCGNGHASLELSQERFRPLGSEVPSDETWGIPFCAKYPTGREQVRQCTLLTAKNQSFTLSKAEGCPRWVYGNADQAGYYRILYDDSGLKALAQSEQELATMERVGLLGDMAAVINGYLPAGQIMPLLTTFAQNPSAEVASKVAQLVGHLDDHLVPDSLKPNYRRYLSDLFKNRAEALGWKAQPNDNPAIRILRPQLVLLMANRAEDQKFIEEAKTLAGAWLADHTAVDQDMLGSVLDGAAAHGDQSLFEKMYTAAKKERTEAVQLLILHALGQFRNPILEKDSMSFLLSNDFDAHQTLTAVLGFGPFPPGDKDVAYDFIKQNWDGLMVKLPSDTGAILPRVVETYCDEEHRVDAQDFFSARASRYTGGPRNLDHVLERMRICEAAKQANEPSVAEFLSKY